MTKLNKRRSFLKKCGFSTAALLLPYMSSNALSSKSLTNLQSGKSKTTLNFIYDGIELSPEEYIRKLIEINQKERILTDFYGKGGTTKLLEEKFAKITGKEKAIYLPTGTMANQIAIKLLNGNKTKVIVPENSHVYRDEADSAQSIHSKRLIPLGKSKSYFDAVDLREKVEYLKANEVFDSGLGTIVIENPVRRTDNTFIPLDKIKEISNYCKNNNYKMHLDGARIHLASAYSGVSISEYTSYFDTIYISLYKYLNASGGAVLCGDAKLIDQVSHQIKILGGTVFQSWNNTSMALFYLNGINKRWQTIIKKSESLISELNKLKYMTIKPLKNGTNVYHLKLNDKLDYNLFQQFLKDRYNILLGNKDKNGIVKFTFNEGLLTKDQNEIIVAWKKGLQYASE